MWFMGKCVKFAIFFKNKIYSIDKNNVFVRIDCFAVLFGLLIKSTEWILCHLVSNMLHNMPIYANETIYIWDINHQFAYWLP